MVLVVIIKECTIRKNNAVFLQHAIGFMCMTEEMITRFCFHDTVSQRQIAPVSAV